ncbi:hypothetical protein [Anaerolinea sp.]|uniref:hypothetical protein n=1 Tax=Anaerolinea sp. TaxID=1872519 RepID=UPI002618D887|nr:hypothetical protein [uncultured Anaerolinea sp.]
MTLNPEPASDLEVHRASFRDPSGFVFRRGGRLYRQVNSIYAREYDHLMRSGLYQRLIDRGWLIPHQEVNEDPLDPSTCYRVIEPEAIPFISYPYEWCFSQLKDAALLTLAIQKEALQAGMILKDASAYNIQFHRGKPILMDTLSFALYEESAPWVAYRQFCQHFLAPLALMSRVDLRFGRLSTLYMDGIPLDFASRLLPFSTRFDFGLVSHLHLHAQAQQAVSRAVEKPSTPPSPLRMSKMGLIGRLTVSNQRYAACKSPSGRLAGWSTTGTPITPTPPSRAKSALFRKPSSTSLHGQSGIWALTRASSAALPLKSAVRWWYQPILIPKPSR